MNTTPSRPLPSVALLSCRFIAGGAFIIAPIMKLQNPQSFMLSINGFGLVPPTLVPFMAYFIPWLELACGILLLYGLWTRAAAVAAGGLYAMFTLALAYVILAGLPVDCGCFGGLFGGETVSWTMIARNGVFLIASGALVWKGGGAMSVDALYRLDGPRQGIGSRATQPSPAPRASGAET